MSLKMGSDRLLRTFGRRLGRKLESNRSEFVAQRLSEFAISGLGSTRGRESLLRADEIWENIGERRRLLEIGFGSGEYMEQRLEEEEDLCILGAEVYLPGVASFFSRLERRQEINNLAERLRIYADDIRLLLSRLSDNIFDEIVILFPDPWPKKRHNKRRLINQDFLEELLRVLRKEGVVKIASDHKELMLWMVERFESSGWHCRQSRTVFSRDALGEDYEDYIENFGSFPEEWRPTRYQQKAFLAGRDSYYAEFSSQS